VELGHGRVEGCAHDAGTLNADSLGGVKDDGGSAAFAAVELARALLPDLYGVEPHSPDDGGGEEPDQRRALDDDRAATCCCSARGQSMGSVQVCAVGVARGG